MVGKREADRAAFFRVYHTGGRVAMLDISSNFPYLDRLENDRV
jgi:hypothetical protein